VLGLLSGLTIGLLAVGLVLVFKANRFLNLAHAQIGTVPALLLAKARLDWHWNWWLAFAAALAVGVLTAVVVERFLVRPLLARTKSPVRLLLLSLAVSQLLLGLTYIPDLGPSGSATRDYPQPFTANPSVGGVHLTGMNILTAILVPAVVLALAAFMRYSSLGKQIRAAASNPDAARLCGISIRRVSAIAWGIAGTCSVLSAVLQAPTQASFNINTLGPYLLMLTLGAAAVGAFVSLPLALGGGIVLGLVSELSFAQTSNSADAEVIVFGVILAVVLVRGRAIGQVFQLAGGVIEESPPLRVPATIRGTALERAPRIIIPAVVLVLLVAWPRLPYFNTNGHRFELSLILIYALLGIALTMLLGWGGQVSLGHFALVGLGAYLTARWQPHGLTLPVLFLLVGLVCAFAMVIIGLPALRVRGLSLAVTTLGFAVIATDWLFHQSWVGSSQGFGVTVTPPKLAAGLGRPSSQQAIYYVALVVLVIAAVSATLLKRSGPGRLIVAVKDNERASSAFGIAPASVKLAVLGVSGFFAGVAGVLWSDAWQQASPTMFTADISIAIVAIPVIGGLGSVGGAIAAAITLYGGTFFIGPHVSGLFGDFGNNLGFTLFLAGAGQIIVLISAPNGLAGIARARWQALLDRHAHGADPAVTAEPSVPGVTTNEVAARTGPDDVCALEVRGVRVQYGGIVALNEPDLEVRAGEIVGLIGTNGAGKTTLMNVISGLTRSSQGSVKLFGDEVADLPTDLRVACWGLARSFQDATLFPSLTVLDAVQVPICRQHKVGMVPAMVGAPWVSDVDHRTRDEAQEIVDRFGLSAWADLRTGELSTGTRRICDLAAQVAAQPRLLLLDEPTAGVAQREAEAFGPLLRRIRDVLDCSILIVEHDMPLLMGLCDRVYAMEAGSVIAEGTPAEIRKNPRVIASYLGNEQAAVDRSGPTDRKASRRTQ
jgi:ABC-type branched-subunit amino acid transport system ATPase component/ABC-type branched-subunit amino acid transport system permease subunit